MIGGSQVWGNPYRRAKIFAFSDKEEMTLREFMIEGATGLTLFRTLFENYQNSCELSFMFSTLAWTACA